MKVSRCSSCLKTKFAGLFKENLLFPPYESSAPPFCKCVPFWQCISTNIRQRHKEKKLLKKIIDQTGPYESISRSPTPPSCKCVPLCPCPTSPSLMTFGIWHRFNKSQHFLSAHLLERSVQLCKDNNVLEIPVKVKLTCNFFFKGHTLIHISLGVW